MAGPLRCLRQLPLLLHCSTLGVARPSLQASLMLHGYRENRAHQTLQARHFATKKAKAKGKSPARVSINASLVEDIINLEEVSEDMHRVVHGLQEDFSKNLSIRTSPGALDHITVATKDGKFPLNQLGQVSLKSPQLILVNMSNFPESAAAAIKAIRESGMNLNPEADGLIIRVPIPKRPAIILLIAEDLGGCTAALMVHVLTGHPSVGITGEEKLMAGVTREHRENLATLAKQLTNKAKESLRKVRAGAISQAKKAKSSVSEDTIRLIEKQIQQMVDDAAAEMEKLLVAKTKELLG